MNEGQRRIDCSSVWRSHHGKLARDVENGEVCWYSHGDGCSMQMEEGNVELRTNCGGNLSAGYWGDHIGDGDSTCINCAVWAWAEGKMAVNCMV